MSNSGPTIGKEERTCSLDSIQYDVSFNINIWYIFSLGVTEKRKIDKGAGHYYFIQCKKSLRLTSVSVEKKECYLRSIANWCMHSAISVHEFFEVEPFTTGFEKQYKVAGDS